MSRRQHFMGVLDFMGVLASHAIDKQESSRLGARASSLLVGTELAAPVLPETMVMLRVPHSALAARLPFLILVVARPAPG